MGLMNIGIKRARESEFDNINTMANCLMLLSRVGKFEAAFNIINNNYNDHQDDHPSRVFECKTCNRQFPSFQALGGHRASHKKPKLGGDLSLQSHVPASPPKPKTHECSICGQEFAVGQALGGHMRRHRAATNEENQHQSPVSSSSISSVSHDEPVVKKSNSGSRRVWCLDLNLTPLENDLEFGIGRVVAPAVDCML